MTTRNTARLSILLATIVLAGALATAASAQSAPAPTMKVGDRWVYNVTSGFGLTAFTYQETREVTAVAGSAFSLKVTGKTAGGVDFTRVDEYVAPGSLRVGALCNDEVRRFPNPLQRVSFPIEPGRRVSKWIDVISDPAGTRGQMNYSFRPRSWEKVTVPAGTFDAIRVDVLMILDDADAFRNATNCNFTYWYAPAVRATVRERRFAQYTDIDPIMGAHPVLRASYELESFSPGKP